VTEPAPGTPLQPAPEPEEGTAIVATPGHFAAWAEKHLAPCLADIRSDVADIEVKAGTALAAVQKAAPVLEKIAALVEKSVKAGTLPAEIVTEAESVALEAAGVARDLAAFGL
jgi:hypothetical protein